VVRAVCSFVRFSWAFSGFPQRHKKTNKKVILTVFFRFLGGMFFSLCVSPDYCPETNSHNKKNRHTHTHTHTRGSNCVRENCGRHDKFNLIIIKITRRRFLTHTTREWIIVYYFFLPRSVKFCPQRTFFFFFYAPLNTEFDGRASELASPCVHM